MKKILVAIVIALFLFVTSASALTVAWDTYNDPIATSLRIYSSTDNTNWTLLVPDIPTSSTSVQVPNHTVDNQRVYYLLRAHDSAGNQESGDSNVITFYWTTGGNGVVGPAPVTGIRPLDCSVHDTSPDDGSPEWDLCQGRHRP